MPDPIMGAQCRWGTKNETTPGTAVTVDELIEIISGDLGLAEEAVHTGGLTGTRSHKSSRTRAGSQRISGSVTMQPNAAEWAIWLPRILGAAASGTTFALAETLPAFTVTIDKDNGTDGKVFTYAGCYVSKATIKSEAGGPVELTCDIEGMTEAIGNAGTFPSLTLNTATGPFLHSDSSAAINVAGSAYPFASIEIVIDNMLDTERFLNSTTRSALYPKDRLITVTLTGPYANASAQYPTAATLAAGVAVAATYTNTVHAVSLLWDFVKVHFPRKTPAWNGREEVMLSLSGQAKETASTKELVCTLDSTV